MSRPKCWVQEEFVEGSKTQLHMVAEGHFEKKINDMQNVI